MRRIRILRTGTNTGPYNMALDEALFRHYGKDRDPVLRFYAWDIPTVSLGYFQRSDIFGAYFGSPHTGLVRRMTGGRAVIHHLELTYSITAGYDDVFAGSKLTGSYHIIAKMFKKAFARLGINIEVAESAGRSNSPNCFDAASLYEITLDGTKIIGSAQYRDADKFIQHGSIVLDIDYPIWSEVYGAGEDSLKNRFRGINAISGLTLKAADVAASIVKAFSDEWDAYDDAPTEDEKKKAEELDRDKYSSKEWTLRK